MHHVPVPASLLTKENQLKVIVKSGLSPLQVHSFDLRVKASASSAEGSETLKTLRAATYGPVGIVKDDENVVESIFDPEAQKRD